MPSSEDYLDGLLNSINKAKSNMAETDSRERNEQQERIRRRNRVSPDDDFLEMNGLSDYVPPRRKRRDNLRKAVSEDDFLEDFINVFDMDISEEDEDEFLSEFEAALEDVKNEEYNLEDPSDGGKKITLPDGEEIRDFSEDSFAREEEVQTPEEDEDDTKAGEMLMDNIESIVSEAKQKAEDEIASKEEAAMAGEVPEDTSGISLDDLMEGVTDAAPPEEELLQPEFAEDSLDEDTLFDTDTSAKEVPLMDESGEDVDLLSMLASGEGKDLMDIGDLLSADEGGEVLEEAQESYEEGATAAEEGTDVPSLDDIGGGETQGEGEGEGEAKGNIITKILGIVMGLLPFGKGGDKEGEEGAIVDPTPEELAAESEEIAANAEEEEKPKEKKKKEKKEKPKKEKPKKEKKPPKPPKPPKEKKPKEPDNSPKVPIKFILICLILSGSIIVFILIYQKLIPQSIIDKKAAEAFEAGEYFKTYTLLDETDLGEDGAEMVEQARLMASMELRYKGFESAMKQRKYAYALDSLILGYNIYKTNKKAADNFNITKIYDEFGQKFVTQLKDQFGMTPEEATEYFNISSRKDYSKKLHQKIDELSLKSRGE
ncbi:MAG: hypothetical protein K6F00_03055 [Lachnospiraceae bacterium]|nr:hypothetical protein [Lachnospiraceae bacterium]